jgi:hypothetical protein
VSSVLRATYLANNKSLSRLCDKHAALSRLSEKERKSKSAVVQIEHWRKQALAFERTSRVSGYAPFSAFILMRGHMCRGYLRMPWPGVFVQRPTEPPMSWWTPVCVPTVPHRNFPPSSSFLGLRSQLTITSAPSPTRSSNSWDSPQHPESTDRRRRRLHYQSLQSDSSSSGRSTKKPPLLAPVHPTICWIDHNTRDQTNSLSGV